MVNKIQNKDNGKNEHWFYQSCITQFRKREKCAKNASIKIPFSDKIARNVISNMEANKGTRETQSNKV